MNNYIAKEIENTNELPLKGYGRWELEIPCLNETIDSKESIFKIIDDFTKSFEWCEFEKGIIDNDIPFNSLNDILKFEKILFLKLHFKSKLYWQDENEPIETLNISNHIVITFYLDDVNKELEIYCYNNFYTDLIIFNDKYEFNNAAKLNREQLRKSLKSFESSSNCKIIRFYSEKYLTIEKYGFPENVTINDYTNYKS